MATPDLIAGFEEILKPKTQDQKVQETKTETLKKEPAHFWLNVGIPVVVNGKEVLLTLPMGIPLDKLKAKPVPNNDSDFAKMREAEAKMWEQLREQVICQLKPGQSERIPQFVVEVRRINEKEATEEQEPNPYSIGKLTFGTPKIAAPVVVPVEETKAA